MALIKALSTPIFGENGIPDLSDPFRYGWRYVQNQRDDGTFWTEQVPLILEDVLHPEEGDQVTHNEAHQRCLHYLRNVFESRLAAEQRVAAAEERLRELEAELRRLRGNGS